MKRYYLTRITFKVKRVPQRTSLFSFSQKACRWLLVVIKDSKRAEGKVNTANLFDTNVSFYSKAKVYNRLTPARYRRSGVVRASWR